MERSAEQETEYQLLGNVLDGLDDLYDDALGPRAGAGWWLERLLVATSAAFAGTAWERRLGDAADGLKQIRMGSGSDTDKTIRTLAITDALRLEVAQRWSELEVMGP